MLRHLILYTSLFFLVVFTSCGRDQFKVDISGIDYDLEIKRFDRELFMMEQDSIEAAIDQFYMRYGDFFDVYNVHILNIGAASERYFPSYISMFINDPLNQELFEYEDRVFSDISVIESELEGAVKRYMYHFPDHVPPEIVFYISGFNLGLFSVGNTVGVGLDQYLGRDCAYYDQLGIAEYMQYNQYPGKIPGDAMYTLATSLFPYNDSIDNVVNRMIYGGMLQYFIKAMLPESADSTLIGFSPEQMNWCRSNEKQMWAYLIEHKLLFSGDDLTIRKLTEHAPNTQYYTAESPGRAAVWQGWQIVKAYARRNPQKSLAEIMAVTDYQSILQESRYDP